MRATPPRPSRAVEDGSGTAVTKKCSMATPVFDMVAVDSTKNPKDWALTISGVLAAPIVSTPALNGV